MPIRKAAKTFEIPRPTLQFRLSNKFVKARHGRPTILSTDEEKTLVSWITDCHKKGFPRRKDDIIFSVKQFLENDPRPNPFKDNCPGDGWFKAFLKRNPELSDRKAEGVTAASANVSESDIRKWFDKIHSYLQEKGCDDISQDPSRIFNGDETGFQLCPQNNKVLAPKGAKNVYEVDSVRAKSSITVMFAYNAAGDSTPPLIIYPGKRLKRLVSTVPEDWGVGRSETGWMKREIFFEYIANLFYPALRKQNIELPLILFVDGHKTHLDRKLSDLCTELKIILISLYPNATRIIQPCDVSTFKPLKDGWRKGILEWRRHHPTEEITKEKFAPILKCVIEEVVRPKIIINGFKACGLFPWNPNAIDFSKCLGKNIKSDHATGCQPPVTTQLNYEKFIEIVGLDRMEKFKTFNNLIHDKDNDFYTLFTLWKEFQRKENPKVSTTSVENEPNEKVAEMKEDSQDDQETLLNEDILFNETNKEQLGTNETAKTLNKFENANLEIAGIPIIFEEIDSTGRIIAEWENPQSLEHTLTNEDVNKNILLSNTSSITLHEHLHWPKTPERKGKRNVERMPYVITSSGWKNLYDKKENEKQSKAEEKESRKREREQKKKDKLKESENKKQKISKKETCKLANTKQKIEKKKQNQPMK